MNIKCFTKNVEVCLFISIQFLMYKIVRGPGLTLAQPRGVQQIGSLSFIPLLPEDGIRIHFSKFFHFIVLIPKDSLS
jgi:hypothetical protein